MIVAAVLLKISVICPAHCTLNTSGLSSEAPAKSICTSLPTRTMPVMTGAVTGTAFVVHDREKLSIPTVSRKPLPMLAFNATTRIHTFESRLSSAAPKERLVRVAPNSPESPHVANGVKFVGAAPMP